MLNFTVGPVMSHESIRQIGSEQVPYFRTDEFSKIMLENEKLVKKFAYASNSDRVIFLTGSGTAAMEAAVTNVFSRDDKVLVINGGSFGFRFVELCMIHEIPFEEIRLETGQGISEEMFKKYENAGFTGLLVNVHETSTGVHYDMDILSKFCKKNNLLFVVDSISSFLADPFNMSKLGVDIMIAGSQKALACPPGISLLVLSPRAIDRVEKSQVKSLYFNLKKALLDGERGQTPFTPAVGILLQINQRLKNIEASGGVEEEIRKVRELALDFRQRISDLPFKMITISPSNAVTSLAPKTNVSAYQIFNILKNNYNIWVCPNGGALKDRVFRVGHIGDLSIRDNTTLINALKDMLYKKMI